MLFSGVHIVSNHTEAIKNFTKLKKILIDCEWFDLSQLEKQYLEGKFTWDLGQFLDIEVERINEKCRELSIQITFDRKVAGSEN